MTTANTTVRKVTLWIPESLYKPLELLCSQQRVQLQGYIVTMILDALSSGKKLHPPNMSADDKVRYDLRLSDSMHQDLCKASADADMHRTHYVLSSLQSGLKRHGYI